ncbi:18101_t:CDS:2 [Funneliformis geosporum]|nr:18101_t:CDS:2 [Funneliformis geosporum]
MKTKTLWQVASEKVQNFFKENEQNVSEEDTEPNYAEIYNGALIITKFVIGIIFASGDANTVDNIFITRYPISELI